MDDNAIIATLLSGQSYSFKDSGYEYTFSKEDKDKYYCEQLSDKGVFIGKIGPFDHPGVMLDRMGKYYTKHGKMPNLSEGIITVSG